MTTESYGQFCGLARAFEIIGGRWSPLIVRNLLLGPRTYADLAESLHRSTPEVLSLRLIELEAAGVLSRSERDGVTYYALTAYGRDLEPVLFQLGLWGARALGDPRPGDILTLDVAILGLRTTFRPEKARGVRVGYELRFGEMVLNARIDDGALTVEEGPLPGADLVIESPVLRELMAAELSPTDALWHGLVDARGDPSRLATFVELFHIPPGPRLPPAPATGSAR